jgi:hypothetical protein
MRLDRAEMGVGDLNDPHGRAPSWLVGRSQRSRSEHSLVK